MSETQMSLPMDALDVEDGTSDDEAYEAKDGHDFFVQEFPREPWHVESKEHCEVMLCGKVISVDLATANIQYRWGPKKCPDCFLAYYREKSTGRR